MFPEATPRFFRTTSLMETIHKKKKNHKAEASEWSREEDGETGGLWERCRLLPVTPERGRRRRERSDRGKREEDVKEGERRAESERREEMVLTDGLCKKRREKKGGNGERVQKIDGGIELKG